MKQKIILFFCLCLMIFLLLHPQDALAAAKDGLSLWLNVMIPTLLPFLILTGILLKTGNIQKLLRPLSPAGKILLGLSPAGLYVLILGLLCGYPIGAKLAHDLYIEQQISRREGEYLLTFSCNASPAFILSYLSRASCDLDVTVKTGTHQKLFVQLRRLRKSVEASRMNTGRYQIVSGSLRSTLSKHWCLDLKKSLFCEELSCEHGNLALHHDISLKIRSS